MAPMLVPIESLNDPRIAPYRNLKDHELARQGNRFIAEGDLVVRRLLASTHPVESLLVAEHRLPKIAPHIPPGVPVHIAPASIVNQIVGYKFHTGIMAVGIRPPSPTLDAVAAAWTGRVTLMILPEVEKADNLGSMLRIAAAFGLSAVILGERSCDPYYRQAVRVSMGAIFRLPVVRCETLAKDMLTLRQKWDVQLAATVLADDAEPLATAKRPPRLALLFGNEAQGLPQSLTDLCDRRLTIPMHLADSLNVAVSAGVFLYHFTQLV